MSTERSEDDAWRSIVDNYGRRAEIDEPEDQRGSPPEAQPGAQPPGRSGMELERATAPVPDPWDGPEERFVPPVPPRAPRLPLPRRLAWCAVLGSPVALVVALLGSLAIPELVGYALVAAFVGGFAYLVATMQRAESRDPWDNGARL